MARHAPLGFGQNTQGLPDAIKYTRFRSQLEVSFALQLEARGIRWFYEPERIERYLLDFYLPDCKCWVEVKGRVSSRDHLLLRAVAQALHSERKHRLYMWTSRQVYAVGAVSFIPMSYERFWQLVK